MLMIELLHKFNKKCDKDVCIRLNAHIAALPHPRVAELVALLRTHADSRRKIIFLGGTVATWKPPGS